jgi:hypothetical protein
VLPPLDLSVLERGMRAFLAQLEQIGSSAAGGGSRLSLWVLAGAAAATACEIARRQLRSAQTQTQAENPLAGFPLDPPFAE